MRSYKKKRKNYIIIFVIFIVCIMPVVVCYGENSSDTYYVLYKNNEENQFYIELGKQQELFTSTSDSIDLENLEFLPQATGMNYTFSAETADLEFLTAKARKNLLRDGYAKLINLDIATDDEIENQQYAQEMKLGFWDTITEKADRDVLNNEEADTDEINEDNAEDSDMTENKNWLSEKWQALCLWFKEEKELIITSILGCGILAVLGRAIIRFLRTKKKIVFFGGANSAGKTTMSLYLINPDASREDLQNQEPTLKLKKERIIRDDTNRRMTLKACLLDSPGHELRYIIDELSLTLRTRILRKKYAVIIIVAATKSFDKRNEIDRQYISDQLATISKLWSAVLGAKRIVKPKNVILFINKLDLYDHKENMISEFADHKRKLTQICKESNINFVTISGSVINKSGMTELMQVLKK